MVGTTFYQQRQMQKASPPGAASSQQQAILKFMPIMFGVFGYTFPAGLSAVLDHLEPLADRAAVRPAASRPHRPGRDGAADRRAARQEREQARQAGVHGPDAGARRAGAAERSGGQPTKKPSGRSREALGRRSCKGTGEGAGPHRRAPKAAPGDAKGGAGATRTGSATEHGSAEAWWRQRWPGRRRSGHLASRRPSRRRSTNWASPSRRLGSRSSRSRGRGCWGSARMRRSSASAWSLPDVDPEDLEEQADTAADFLEELLGHMGIDAVAEPSSTTTTCTSTSSGKTRTTWRS